MSDTWAIRLIRAALKIQDKVTSQVSPTLRRAGAGRKARINVDDEDGGVIIVKWDGHELKEDPSAEGIRNEFFIRSQTLFDLATGELEARAAVAARLIRVTGDRSIYDSEDMMKLLEKLQEVLAQQLGK